MQPAQLQRHVEKGDLAPVYLLTGEGHHAIEEAWTRIQEQLVPPQARRFNGERLSARESTFSQVRDRLSTISMFGKRRLLAVQQIELWNKEQQKELIAYLGKPNPMACLVLMSTEKKGLDKVQAAVEAIGVVVRFPAMTEREAPRWLQEQAKRLGKVLPPQVAAHVVEHVGADPGLLERELEKLAAYVGDRGQITMDDAREAVSGHRSYSVFEMLRYVSGKDTQRALASLRSLLLAGEQPLVVFALLARQIRMVWQVRDGLARGVAQGEIGKKLNLYPNAMKNYVQQSKAFSESRLRGFHRALCETDMALKLSSISPEVLLEEFVLSLCLHK